APHGHDHHWHVGALQGVGLTPTGALVGLNLVAHPVERAGDVLALQRHPWRAFHRGLRLLRTNVCPRRRTIVDPGWRFSDFSEFLTFIGILSMPKNGCREHAIPASRREGRESGRRESNSRSQLRKLTNPSAHCSFVSLIHALYRRTVVAMSFA